MQSMPCGALLAWTHLAPSLLEEPALCQHHPGPHTRPGLAEAEGVTWARGAAGALKHRVARCGQVWCSAGGSVGHRQLCGRRGLRSGQTSSACFTIKCFTHAELSSLS